MDSLRFPDSVRRGSNVVSEAIMSKIIGAIVGFGESVSLAPHSMRIGWLNSGANQINGNIWRRQRDKNILSGGITDEREINQRNH